VVGDWDVADASDARHRREAAGLVAAYAQFHLERKVRSLGMVDRTDDAPREARPA
jgi:DNA repair protein RecO (recombination protein O)